MTKVIKLAHKEYEIGSKCSKNPQKCPQKNCRSEDIFGDNSIEDKFFLLVCYLGDKVLAHVNQREEFIDASPLVA